MKALYKVNDNEVCSVMEVTQVSYMEEERVLRLCGPEEDFGIVASPGEANKIIAELYQNDKVDLSSYTYLDIDFDDDDDDDFDDEAILNDILYPDDDIEFD